MCELNDERGEDELREEYDLGKLKPTSKQLEKEFARGMYHMMKLTHAYAQDKGFWDGDRGTDEKKLLLMHSELSEAAQALRDDNPDYNLEEEYPSMTIDPAWPSFSHVEMELADTIIRIFDFAEKKGMKLPEAILAKHKINLQRDYLHGGRKF